MSVRLLAPLAKSATCGLLFLVCAPEPAAAQRPLVGGGYGYNYPSTTFRPGGYVPGPFGGFQNPVTGARYAPGRGVMKSSGLYLPAGGGYYRNPHTGNIYNPNTGSYSTGKNLSFAPGRYLPGGGGTQFNPATGSVYLPGRAVVKRSGVYAPIGGGYYRNPHTGNVYNPYTGAYKSPH